VAARFAGRLLLGRRRAVSWAIRRARLVGRWPAPLSRIGESERGSETPSPTRGAIAGWSPTPANSTELHCTKRAETRRNRPKLASLIGFSARRPQDRVLADRGVGLSQLLAPGTGTALPVLWPKSGPNAPGAFVREALDSCQSRAKIRGICRRFTCGVVKRRFRRRGLSRRRPRVRVPSLPLLRFGSVEPNARTSRNRETPERAVPGLPRRGRLCAAGGKWLQEAEFGCRSGRRSRH
jgi:hypothetical protein